MFLNPDNLVPIYPNALFVTSFAVNLSEESPN